MGHTACPYCIADLDPARLNKHIAKVHAALVSASESDKRAAVEAALQERLRLAAKKEADRELAWRRWLADPVNRQLHLICDEIGIDPSGIESVPMASFECFLCGRHTTRVLYRLSLKDNTYVDLGQDCFDKVLRYCEAGRHKGTSPT